MATKKQTVSKEEIKTRLASLKDEQKELRAQMAEIKASEKAANEIKKQERIDARIARFTERANKLGLNVVPIK